MVILQDQSFNKYVGSELLETDDLGLKHTKLSLNARA
jgi:hypothetical protein